ncbi:MAG TPA: metallophosphoesterase [Kofleriaceae bacterium]|nr:metallophosphoesterase [Kofleriaceae bacterium]
MRLTAWPATITIALALPALAACHAPSDDPGDGAPGDGAGEAPPDAAAAFDAEASGGAVVRFVMMGDQGTGTAKQYAVAAAIRQVCAAEGCDFVVLLGDNLYPDGADSTSDPVWQTAFEMPYAGLDVPFHAILGNHDFGRSGTDWEREDIQVDYSSVSPRWHMPHPHYAMLQGPVAFLMLDTNRLMWDMVDDGDQRLFWNDAYPAIANAPWRIAVGHHPYRSNGHHGNMGSYGGGDSLAPQNDGASMKAFFDERVCGHVDLYVAGHDHDMEWLNAPEHCGGTELVVSGAGGTTAPFERAETPVFWHEDVEAGFLYVVADATTLHGRFIGQSGATLFERTLTKP